MRITVAILSALPFILSANVALAVDDGESKDWMQLPPTIEVSWNQLAAICPQDGVTPCEGVVANRNLTGWVWATGDQVMGLFSKYAPELEGVASPGGTNNFFAAQSFLTAFTPTSSVCSIYFCNAYASGWTSSVVEGQPLVGSVAWGTTPVSINGALETAPVADADGQSPFRGAWLFHPTGPGVFAYDDSGSVASPAGGTAVANVLANDWIAGVHATTALVVLLEVSSTNTGVTLDTVDGSVDVANATPAGSYSLVYRICDITNGGNCDEATVLVTVRPYVIDAVNDAGVVSPATGGAAVANVLANDRLGGSPATVGNVSLEQLGVTPAQPGISLNTSSGAVLVAAGTPPGTFSLGYQICERANPGNCDAATVAVTVRHHVVDAVNDYARGSSKTGGTVLASVFANDTFNGARASNANVSLALVSAPVKGITLNTSTGAVVVAPKSNSGTFALVYRICDRVAVTNCDQATATIELSGKND